MVRVSGLMEQISAGVKTKTPDGLSPAEIMAAIRAHLRPQLRQQHDFFSTGVAPAAPRP